MSPSWSAIGEAFSAHTDPDADHINGGGLVVEDFGDGDLDIMVFFDDSPPILIENDGTGGLVEVVHELPNTYGHPILIDLDDAVHPEILMTNMRILQQVGEKWEEGKLGSSDRIFVDLLIEDLNSDGHIDIFALMTSNEPEVPLDDMLFWGLGEEGFEWDQELSTDSLARKAFDGLLFDWDRDGDRDIYVVNDMGSEYGGNVLWRNDGDRVLTDVSAECDCGLEIDGMGVSPGDYNGDGEVDLYLTATLKNVLLQGQSDGSFVDVTAVTGANMLTDVTQMGWGSTWLDHDNDGDQDILVLQGDLWGDGSDHTDAYEAPFHLLSQDGGTFRDVAPELGFSQTGSFRAVVAAELNGDGVQDFVITDVVAHPWVFLSDGCTENAWIEVVAPPYNRIVVQAGGAQQTAVINQNPGYAAAGPARAWFGLGDVDLITSITITLPDGTALAATNIEPRRRISLQP